MCGQDVWCRTWSVGDGASIFGEVKADDCDWCGKVGIKGCSVVDLSVLPHIFFFCWIKLWSALFQQWWRAPRNRLCGPDRCRSWSGGCGGFDVENVGIKTCSDRTFLCCFILIYFELICDLLCCRDDNVSSTVPCAKQMSSIDPEMVGEGLVAETALVTVTDAEM